MHELRNPDRPIHQNIQNINETIVSNEDSEEEEEEEEEEDSHNGLEFGQAGTINFAFLWFQADHRLDHICPEYGQPGTINLYGPGPEYDQPGIIL